MTNNIDVRNDSRTKYEAILDVRFGQRYNDLNARLYRRLDLVFGFVGLFGGSGALIAAIAQDRAWGIATGALGAAVAVIERLVGAIEKAVKHDEFKRKYAELNVEADELELSEIERQLRQLQADAPSGFHSLLKPAYNVNVAANGRPDYALGLTRWERTVHLFA
jgi:hypothetical protein